MSIRQRTTKLLARRHDLNYFKRMSPLRAWQWYLAAAALGVAVIWFGTTTIVRGDAVFSAGPMSSSHAVMGQRCEVCHIPVIEKTIWTPGFGMRRKVPDSACRACHTAPEHHPKQVTEAVSCGSCHVEHNSAMHLAAVDDKSCTQCHAQLQSRTGALPVAASIHSFAKDHPEFKAVTAKSEPVADGFKFSHAVHLQKGLAGPTSKVTLKCANCHEGKLVDNTAFAANSTERVMHQGATMASVSFEKSCRSCHALEFDKHINGEAPHGDVLKAREFVEQRITDYAKTHPLVIEGEIKNWPALQPLPEQSALPAPHNAQEWIANRIATSEKILWHERCGLCHTPQSAEFPTGPLAENIHEIQKPVQPHARLTSAMFSHAAHTGVTCESCHTAALTSQNSHDVLMPSIQACRQCHDGESSPQGPPVKAGHAESGCFLCHVYHGTEMTASTKDGRSLKEILKQ